MSESARHATSAPAIITHLEADGPLTSRELAMLVGIRRGNVRRYLNELITAGYVIAEARPDDERVTQYRLTDGIDGDRLERAYHRGPIPRLRADERAELCQTVTDLVRGPSKAGRNPSWHIDLGDGLLCGNTLQTELRFEPDAERLARRDMCLLCLRSWRQEVV